MGLITRVFKISAILINFFSVFSVIQHFIPNNDWWMSPTLRRTFLPLGDNRLFTFLVQRKQGWKGEQ